MSSARRVIEFKSADGRLNLHAETYGAHGAPLTVLCLHGLTRNGRDFDALVTHLAPRYRLITADQRGRGRSAWDPEPENYALATYVADMQRLLDHLAVEQVVLIGTSMGGLMSMLLAASQPMRVRGIVLNDIGPAVPTAGLARLRASLETPATIETWADAAAQAQRVNGGAFPDYGASDWDAFARRTYLEDTAGRPRPAYDPVILRGLAASADPAAVVPDMWPVWAQLHTMPILAVRGELSDILSAATFAQMAQRHSRLIAVTVPRRGHAPMLDEPAALVAIDSFLKGLES